MAKPSIKPISEAPNLQTLKGVFGISEQDTIISYGDTIYCPPQGMTTDLLVHELVHCERQGFSAEQAKQWWFQYMNDETFRKIEEGLAFREQYRYCKNVFKDKNARLRIATSLAREFASDRYGCIISTSDALDFITREH